MKKIVLLILIVGSSLFAKEPINYGTFHGNIKTYYPNLKIQDAFYLHNSGTTGIKDGMATRVNDTTMTILKGFSSYAKKSCKSSYGYALDNINVQYTTFGEYNNNLVHVSVNVVCFNK